MSGTGQWYFNGVPVATSSVVRRPSNYVPWQSYRLFGDPNFQGQPTYPQNVWPASGIQPGYQWGGQGGRRPYGAFYNQDYLYGPQGFYPRQFSTGFPGGMS